MGGREVIDRIKRWFLRAYCTWMQGGADWRGDYYESVYWSMQREQLRERR